MPIVGKNVLTQFLRTGCEKQLYLSLFKPTELREMGLPVPLEARPQVQILRDQGKEWEQGKFSDLDLAFPNCLKGQRGAEGKFSTIALEPILRAALVTPTFVIQGEFSVSKEHLLVELGMDNAQIVLLPPLRAFIPDVILVREKSSTDEEVRPNGKRLKIEIGDSRKALQITDIKHTGEANTSYSSEVALYAIALSKWIQLSGLSDRYFVSTKISLWTRARQTSSFIELMAGNPGSGISERLEAYNGDLEGVQFPVFFQNVKKFFTEDLIRVLGKQFGDLEWHVDGRCSGCDYLGYRAWLKKDDQEVFDQNPNNYCVPLADSTGHLSRIATLSRGGRRTLEAGNCGTVNHISGLAPQNDIFDQHNGLRADRGNLPFRAQSLINRTASVNLEASTADMPKWADLEIFISINFDPGSGLLTAIGHSGFFRQRVPFGQQSTISRNWSPSANVVLQPVLGEEEAALIAFLTSIGNMFEFSEANEFLNNAERLRTRTQLYFWDHRQFEELTKAIGRHLASILSNENSRTLMGLAWLFPPETLLEDSEIVISNPVTFLKSIVKKALWLPVPHAITLFNVAANYFEQDRQPIATPSSFMCDPFSDMIPRERIYEIWSGEPLIRIGKLQKARSLCITDYGEVVTRQVRAIRQIAWKLRTDLNANLRSQARSIDIRVPFGFRQMSDDSRLWLGWAKLENATKKIEQKRMYCVDPVELEAEYKILRFTSLISRNGNEVVFRVSPNSVDCKFREQDSFLCLQVDGVHGFCELRMIDIARGRRTEIPGPIHTQMKDVFQARLVRFDRENHTATVLLTDYSMREQQRDFLLDNGLVVLGAGISLVEAGGPSDVEKIESCLRAIGNPSIAVPHPLTVSALGRRRQQPGSDAIRPPAEVIWNGGSLSRERGPLNDADISSTIATIQAKREFLNQSQYAAIENALKYRLSIIWGPPGTGKTTTAAALIAARIIASKKRKEPLRVLITGPTYTAWEKLLFEVLDELKKVEVKSIDVFRVYSESHSGRGGLPGGLDPSLRIVELETRQGDESFEALVGRLQNPVGIVIVGTVANQCYRLGTIGARQQINSFFDFVVIDEGSQLDFCRSLYPLCLLSPGFQLVILGDDLQMPPIFTAEPPAAAAWLVGSIQTYLIKRFDVEKIPLHINYRSAEEFVEFAKSIGYDSRLRTHSPSLKLLPVDGMDRISPGWKGELLFGDYLREILDPSRRLVSVTFSDGKNGQANPFEADLVCAIALELFLKFSKNLDSCLNERGEQLPAPLEKFDPGSFWETGLGIVTPHRAQRALVVRKLKRIFHGHPANLIDQAVDTVERFQGEQRQNIIISFGVGDPDLISDEEKFLLQLERTNVAISRARAKCILLISDDLLYHLPHDKRIIETSRAVKGYVSDFCSEIKRCIVAYSSGLQKEIKVRFKPSR